MKTKNLLPLLFVLITALYSTAQTHVKLNTEPTINPVLTLAGFNDLIPLKSATDGELVLDSMKRTEYLTTRDTSQVYTYTYKYDSEGRQIESVQRASCMFCPGRRDDTKTTYQYDEQGNPKILKNYVYDHDLEEWVLTVQTEYEINSNGELVLYIQKQPDSNNELVNDRKIEFTYSEFGESLSQLESQWNLESKQWDYSSNYVVEYNENGQLILSGDYRYDLENEEWITEYESERFYDYNGFDSIRITFFRASLDDYIYQKQETKVDSIGNIIVSMVSDKDTSGNWEDWLREIFEYDKYGNNIYSEQILWQPSYNMWISSQKTEIEYDLNFNKEVLSISSRLNTSTGLWIPDIRYDYEYDLNGNTLKYSRYVWSTTKNEWENSQQYLYEYDEYNNRLYLGSYNWINNLWWLSYKYDYFYSELSTGVNNNLFQTSDIKIYPNPANEILIVEMKNDDLLLGRVYNSLGEFVKTLPLHQGSNIFNLSELNRGMYFIQIPSDKGLIVSKVIKN